MSAELALLTQLKPKIGDTRLTVSPNQLDTFTDANGTWSRNGICNYSATPYPSSLKMYPPDYSYSGTYLVGNYRTVKIGTRTLVRRAANILQGYNNGIATANSYNPVFSANVTASTTYDICGTSSRVVISDSSTTSQGKFAFSNDGLTFYACTATATTYQYKLAVNTTGTLWTAAYGTTATATFIMTSTDGMTWTSRTPSGGVANKLIHKAIWFSAASKFVYICDNSTPTNGSIQYSSDGYTLTSIDLSSYSSIFNFSSALAFEANGYLYISASRFGYGGYFKISSSMVVTYVPSSSLKVMLCGFANGNFYGYDNGKNVGLYYGTTESCSDGFICSPMMNTAYLDAYGTYQYVDDNLVTTTVGYFPNNATSTQSYMVECDSSKLADIQSGKYIGASLASNANGANTYIKVV